MHSALQDVVGRTSHVCRVRSIHQAYLAFLLLRGSRLSASPTAIFIDSLPLSSFSAEKKRSLWSNLLTTLPSGIFDSNTELTTL